MTRLQRDVSLLILGCALAAVTAAWGQSVSPPAEMTPREPVRPVPPPTPPEAERTASIHVALVGAVNAPATYRLSRPLTYSELIDASGGPTVDASPSVLLIRQGRLHPLLYQPGGVAAADEFGRLREGDVVVLRPQPGVRRAHYETMAEVNGYPRSPQGVRNAHRDIFVHVACIGLAPYPVVLPLNPHQASQHILLREMLGMSDDAIREGTRILTDGGRFLNDGSLQDGAVILFDRRRLPPQAIRPVERFPEPRELPAASPSTPSEPPGTGTSGVRPITQPPQLTAVEQTAAPFTLAPGAGSTAPTRQTAQAVPSPGHLLNQPLRIPGVPFEHDAPASTAGGGETPTSPGGVWNPTPAGTGDDLRPRGAGAETTTPIDLTLRRREATEMLDSTAVTTPTTGNRLAPLGEDRRGIRSAATAPPLTKGAGALRTMGDDETFEGTESVAAETAPGGFRAIGMILLGTLVTTALCLTATWLWARERRRQGLAAAAPAVSGGAPLPPPPRFHSGLQDLVAQRLPLVEEPTLPEPGVRLYGPLVGHRRVYLDPPHASGAGPHFATAAGGARPPSAERIAKHIRAARRGRETVGAAPASPVAAAANIRTPLYDVVLPDSPPSPPTAESPTSRRSGPVGEGEDRLARALRSLREGRG